MKNIKAQNPERFSSLAVHQNQIGVLKLYARVLPWVSGLEGSGWSPA